MYSTSTKSVNVPMAMFEICCFVYLLGCGSSQSGLVPVFLWKTELGQYIKSYNNLISCFFFNIFQFVENPFSSESYGEPGLKHGNETLVNETVIWILCLLRKRKQWQVCSRSIQCVWEKIYQQQRIIGKM